MKWLTLTLVLFSASPAAAESTVKLDFSSGTLDGWEKTGDAFYVTTARGRGPSRELGVCSSDRGSVGRAGLLRKQFVVPPGASEIRFWAYAVCAGADSD